MRSLRAVFVVLGVVISSEAYAQAPRGEVAGTLLVGKEIVGGDLSQVGGWGWGWNGSFAVQATDRVSVVGAMSGLYQSVDGEFPVQDRAQRSVPFRVTFDTLGFAGGVRVHGDRSSRVRPFFQVLFGYSTADAAVGALGDLDLTTWSSDQRAIFSVSGPALTPGGGLDVGVAERVAVRLQIDLPSVFSGGTVTSSLVVGAGFVFAVGN